jgi:hypothetical protein
VSLRFLPSLSRRHSLAVGAAPLLARTRRRVARRRRRSGGHWAPCCCPFCSPQPVGPP